MCNECKTIMNNDNESILLQKYPQEWLQHTEIFWTNEEIIQMSQQEREGLFLSSWFNPFDEPEKLEELRQDFKPREWRRYCEENFPGINIKEQYKLAKEEEKHRRTAKCGVWHYRKSFTKIGQTTSNPNWCNNYDICPHCRERKLKELQERYSNIAATSKIYKVTSEQLKKLQETRTKEDYELSPIDNNNSYIMLDKDDIVEGLEEVVNGAGKMAEAAVNCTGRKISGKLHDKHTGSKSATPPVEKAEDDEAFECMRRVYELEFSDESTVKNFREIDEIVLQEFEFDCDAEKTGELLQDTIYRLEQKTAEVADRHCVKIHFIYTEKELVYLEKVDWSLVEKVPK